jgi:hypothetical protein
MAVWQLDNISSHVIKIAASENKHTLKGHDDGTRQFCINSQNSADYCHDVKCEERIKNGNHG